MSKIGASLCSFYALIILLCLYLTYTAGGDYKGQYIFLQLPIVLQMAAVQALGLSKFFTNLSWVGAYLLFALPTFILLYGLGWLIDGRRGKPTAKLEKL
ncbi:MAG: hypothetical protein WBP13_03825 [Methylophilaceae bacterium]